MTDNEATQFAPAEENTPAAESIPAAENTAKTTEKKAGKWRSRLHDAASTGIGVLVGAATPVMMGMKSDASDETDGHKTPTANHSEVLSHPELVDEQIPVATTVNDNMSFGEAFAAARTETGPGGVFEWHGNLYGTYTAEEWNAMSAEERADYGRHFAWNRMDHSQSDVASSNNTHTDSNDNHSENNTDNNSDDIDVVSVNHNDNSHTHAHTVPASNSSAESEIEVLGIVHNDELDANIAAVNIDGQDVYLIDVDNDQTFDYMVNDSNGNGHADEGEIADISTVGMTIGDLTDIAGPEMNYDAGSDCYEA